MCIIQDSCRIDIFVDKTNQYKFMNNKILVIGSSNTDMTIKGKKLPAPGETVTGGIFYMGPGGKGANQAVAMARLGADVLQLRGGRGRAGTARHKRGGTEQRTDGSSAFHGNSFRGVADSIPKMAHSPFHDFPIA